MFSEKEVKQNMKEFKDSFDQHKMEYNPPSVKDENVQNQIPITDNCVKDLNGETQEIAQEDLQNRAERYLKITMPKTYWEVLIKYLRSRIPQKDTSETVKKVKNKDIPIENSSQPPQEKVNSSQPPQEKINSINQKNKKQYTIIVPCEGIPLKQDQFMKKYKLKFYQASIQKNKNLNQYWVTTKSIESYHSLLFTISRDIKNTHPDLRTKNIVDEMCRFHLNLSSSTDENQQNALENLNNENKIQKSKSLSSYEQKPLNTLNLNKDMQSNTQLQYQQSTQMSANQNNDIKDKIEKKLKVEYDDFFDQNLQNISEFDNKQTTSNQDNIEKNYLQQKTNNILEHTPLQNQLNITFDKIKQENSIQSEINLPPQSLRQNQKEQGAQIKSDSKIDELEKRIYYIRDIKNKMNIQLECETIKRLFESQEIIEKIKACPERKDYIRGGSYKRDFKWVYDIHTEIFNDFIYMMRNPSNTLSAKQITERIKKRIRANFPQTHFTPYLNSYEQALQQKL